MAHKKAGGSKARQGSHSKGKRLGVKLSDGSAAKTGQIIVRQRGSDLHAGDGVGIGRDFTLFALRGGRVKFSLSRGRRRKISVVP